MHKTMIMERLDDKETKGCFRYGLVHGDVGIATLYVRKESVDGVPPDKIKLTVTATSEAP